MQQITLFKDIKDISSPYITTVDKVFNAIKIGKWANKVHRVRLADDTNRRAFKAELPCICFSGTFSERADDKLIKHSGLIVLDFDHIKNLADFKMQVCKNEYTFAAFISPSGDGLKVLIKIPDNPKMHEAHFLGLLDIYPNLDRTGKNISRVCFVSYDSELFVNYNSKVFDKIGRVEKKETIIKTCIRTDYAKLDTIADIIRRSSDGNKHHNLIKASRLAGGYIAGGLIDEYIAIQTLETEINNKNISDFKGARKTIQDGIDYGKADPITEINCKEKTQKIITEDIIIEDAPAKDIIFLKDVRQQIIYSYENGTSKGETTHFHDIDKHFRWKRGEITLMHGIGNHGKSQLILQLALAKAVFDDYKWGVFSPENMPVEEFYKDLMHSFTGKSPEKFHTNQMTIEERDVAMDFIGEHFFLIYPENDDPTPQYINTRFRELIIKHGIDGCIIDPYNQLDNDLKKTGGMVDQYLSLFLTNSKRFAVQNNVFYVIVAHPRGDIKKEKDGLNYLCPDVYDLSGGAMWNNKMDNILVTHRPYYTTDKQNPLTLFKSQKIKKQKLCGIPGEVELMFDRDTSRYSTQLNGCPFDSYKMHTRTELPIQANKEFDYLPKNETAPF
jgi:twinkle protein